MSKLLVGAGADPDRVNPHNSCTELICAAESGRVPMIRLLIDIGADVNKADETYAMTPLIWAVKRGHNHVVRILLEAGADPNVADNFGVAPLISEVPSTIPGGEAPPNRRYYLRNKWGESTISKISRYFWIPPQNK